MRVLLAVDGSACSEMAVQTVLDRFRSGDTQVKVLHAVEWMREMPLCFQYGTGPSAGHDVVESRNKRYERAREPCSVDIVRMPVADADREALQSRHAAHS
jgi:nucleotide-binding universal stress UspA family protein